MNPSKAFERHLEAEIHFSANGEDIVLRPGERSEFVDQAVASHEAHSWIFLPLGTLEEDSNEDFEERRAQLTSELSGLSKIEATLVGRDQSVPGFWIPGLSRKQARRVARQMGTGFFYWGRPGVEVELHPARVLDEDPFEDDSTFDRARQGFRALIANLVELLSRGWNPLRSSAGDLTLIGLMLGFPAALAVTWFAAEWDHAPHKYVTHPALLAALLGGLVLRGALGREDAGSEGEEKTHSEAQRAWEAFAPRLAFSWFVVFVSALALSASRELFRGESFEPDIADAIIAVWLLPAIGYSRDFGEAFQQLIQSAVAAFVTMITLRISLMIAEWTTQFFWGIVTEVIVRELPEWLVSVTDFASALVAQLAILSLALGTAWRKEEERYTLWLSGELQAVTGS